MRKNRKELSVLRSEYEVYRNAHGYVESFQKQLTVVLGYDADTAKDIVRKAKTKYHIILAALKAADRNPYSWNMDFYEYPDGSGYERGDLRNVASAR
ncbi:MAG: hypothetical protein Q4D42_12690 [Eubacteriales bacterium]|nr:hypothetical protein [Eubacteriales bacterium]